MPPWQARQDLASYTNKVETNDYSGDARQDAESLIAYINAALEWHILVDAALKALAGWTRLRLEALMASDQPLQGLQDRLSTEITWKTEKLNPVLNDHRLNDKRLNDALAHAVAMRDLGGLEGGWTAAAVALASGSFCYVALIEVLPRELSHGRGAANAAANLPKLLMLALGYALMALLAVWL